MRYELLLQPRGPGVPFDVAALEALLGSHGATPRGDGTWRWTLSGGEVELKPLVEGGLPVALELHIPLTEKDDLLRAAVERGSALTEEAGLTLFDPQLLRALSPRDADAVAEQYRRTAHYAGALMGQSESVLAGFAAPSPGLTSSTKVMFGIIAFLVVLYFVVDGLIGAIR